VLSPAPSDRIVRHEADTSPLPAGNSSHRLSVLTACALKQRQYGQGVGVSMIKNCASLDKCISAQLDRHCITWMAGGCCRKPGLQSRRGVELMIGALRAVLIAIGVFCLSLRAEGTFFLYLQARTYSRQIVHEALVGAGATARWSQEASSYYWAASPKRNRSGGSNWKLGRRNHAINLEWGGRCTIIEPVGALSRTVTTSRSDWGKVATDLGI